MNAHLALPGEEQYISSYSVDAGTLHLRLSSDYHEGHPSSAFELKAVGVQNVAALEARISNAIENQIYVYCSWSGGHLVLATEDGEEIQVEAGSYEGHPSDANLAELKNALDRVSGWLELERESNSKAHGRLRAAAELLGEQCRRIEAKSKAHDRHSTAGVLYGQQLAFIERVLNAVQGTSNQDE